MKKRIIIRIISFLLALIIVTLVFCIKYYRRSLSFQNEIRYTYSRSFEEMNSSFNKMRVALEKLSFVSSVGQISQLATDIYTEARIAKQAFSQLPTGAQAHENVNKFLSQVGNYTVYLAQKIIDGGEINEIEKSNLGTLTTIAANMSDNFSQLQVEIDRTGHWNENLTKNIQSTVENDVFVESISKLDESIIDYPTLLYDGPYSDYISSGSVYLVGNAVETDEQTAKTVAANALGIEVEELTLDNFDSGRIPAFNFVYGEGTASVSINGGKLISLRKYNVGSEQNLSYVQAKKSAEKFMGEMYKDTFLANYYFTDNGVCVVNFALVSDGVICYADLVKVGVDMSNGDIVFFDARGYLTNNKPREIESPAYTLEQAQAKLNGDLTVKSTALTLIPTSGGYEKLCYEFLCRTKENREILVYISAETLAEEDIFLIFKTNGGTLTK